MPVETVINPVSRTSSEPVILHPKDRCIFHAESRSWLEGLGLNSAAAFLAYPGEILGGHIRRNVSRVRLPTPGAGRIAYLKRDHSIRWRERFRHFREGYCLSSKCEREARVLIQLEAEGLAAPRCLAWGEDGRGRAFLLIDGLPGTVPLRRFLRGASHAECREVAVNLAQLLASYHATGFTQPDLLAKHVLVDPETLACTVIDWQRSVQRSAFNRPASQRALLQLRWSQYISPLLTLRFLTVYFRTLAARGIVIRSRKAFAVEMLNGGGLACSRAIREERLAARVENAPEQPLVWIDGEAICAVPAFAASLNLSSARDAFYPDEDRPEDRAVVAGRAVRILRERRKRLLPRFILSERRLRSLKPLRVARIAMHLERLGIPAPRALAFGHRHRGAFITDGFVALEVDNRSPATFVEHWNMIRQSDGVKSRAKLLHDAGALYRRLHEAGCLQSRPSDELFAPSEGPSSIRINALECLDFRRTILEGYATHDLVCLHAKWKGRINIGDAVRFLRAYLGLDRLDANAKSFIRRDRTYYDLRWGK